MKNSRRPNGVPSQSLRLMVSGAREGEKMKRTQKTPDIRVENHGSIFLFRWLTKAGKSWIGENVSAEGWQFFGDALAVDHHYARDLASGMLNDGLRVE